MWLGIKRVGGATKSRRVIVDVIDGYNQWGCVFQISITNRYGTRDRICCPSYVKVVVMATIYKNNKMLTTCVGFHHLNKIVYAWKSFLKKMRTLNFFVEYGIYINKSDRILILSRVQSMGKNYLLKILFPSEIYKYQLSTSKQLNFLFILEVNLSFFDCSR